MKAPPSFYLIQIHTMTHSHINAHVTDFHNVVSRLRDFFYLNDGLKYIHKQD